MLAVLAAAAACSDRSGGITGPGDPSLSTAVVPGIAIGADTNQVTVARGGSVTVNVRVARVAGFTGAVTLAVDTTGIARGVRATIANATVAANDTAARVVTITADTTATASTTPTTVRITASGAGVSPQTLLMNVVVANPAPAPVGTFTIAGPTTAPSGVAGTTVNVPITIARAGGFTGRVTFTATGAPTGVTVVFDSASTAGGTSTLRLTLPATLAAGTYPIVVSGATPGLAAQTATINLTVTSSSVTIGAPTNPPVVLAGTSNIINVPLSRPATVSANIAIVANDLPTGLTVTTSSTTTSTGAAAAVIVSAEADVPAGTYPVTLNATDASGGTATSTFDVTVVRNNPSFGFQFATPPATPVQVAQGGTTTTSVTLVRISTLAPDAILNVSNVSRGLIVTLDRDRSAEGTVGIRVSATPEALPGIYQFTVQGATVRGNMPPVTVRVQVTAGPTPAQIFPATTTEAQIFGLAHEANLGEIMAGTLAQQRALTAEVRAFAQMMVTMHTAVDTASQNLAQRLSLTPTLPDSTLPRLQQQEMATLSATAAGLTFDRLYISQQIVAHRRTLELIDAALARTTLRAELRTLLQDTLRPAVAAHLQQALTIQGRIGSP